MRYRTNWKENYSYFKYDKLFTNIIFIYSALLPSLPSSYILFLHHVLPVLRIGIAGAWFSQRDYFLRSGIETVGKDKKIINRVVAPPGGWTSPPTSWSNR
jgi:hypothetical protein